MTLALPGGIIQMENYPMKLKFCGAAGTRGAAMVGGAQWIRIHGEAAPAAALKASIERELGWHCAIAADLEEVSL